MISSYRLWVRKVLCIVGLHNFRSIYKDNTFPQRFRLCEWCGEVKWP